jgi:hypothetical protein
MNTFRVLFFVSLIAVVACVNKTAIEVKKDPPISDAFATLIIGSMLFWHPITVAICRYGFGLQV